ncbi:MAG: DUF285 domain-containing protein, partial [Proteobacteria bacterium]|nr:DUF285 domain-containing protein [Pseudomonadota bacterium]
MIEDISQMRPFMIKVAVKKPLTVVRLWIPGGYNKVVYEAAVDDSDYMEYEGHFEYCFEEIGTHIIRFRGDIPGLQMRDKKIHEDNVMRCTAGLPRELPKREKPKKYERGAYLYEYIFVNVVQWGDIRWKTMKNMFTRCRYLTIRATDAPDLSDVTSMAEMFSKATSFNAPIGHWDVSHVCDMSGLFNEAIQFNQSIENWNTQNVKNMNDMFCGAQAFNQPLNRWNTGSVPNMRGMFLDAKSFNQPIGDWDTHSVEDMSLMFAGAEKFDQPIGDWDTGNVQNMRHMFDEAKAFNQPIGNWDTHQVNDMSYMFSFAKSFNQPIGNWD